MSNQEILNHLEKREIWYSKVALCLKCDWASGEVLPQDKCLKYNMPLYMCGRKKRCKHFDPKESHPATYYRWNERGDGRE